MSRFKYNCPDCGNTNRMHGVDCRFDGVPMWELESAYIDIISTLLSHGQSQVESGNPPGMGRKELVEAVSADANPRGNGDETPTLEALSTDESASSEMDYETKMVWTQKHDACLNTLVRTGRVSSQSEMGGLHVTDPDQNAMGVIPLFDPLKTVFEYGPIDGCKDISVYTMVSWCELKELDWNATTNFIQWWLEKTGRWESESWGESRISDLCDAKYHIHNESMGWGDYPRIAKREMTESDHTPKLDARDMDSDVDRTTFE